MGRPLRGLVPRGPSRARWAVAAVAILCAIPGGMALAAPGPVDRDPLRVDGEIRAWIDRLTLPEGSVRRFEAVARELESRNFRPVSYPEATPTAAEAFRTGRANCVGYAFLLSAVTRGAGLPTFFALGPRPRATSDGDLIEEHLVVGLVERGRLHLRDADGSYRPAGLVTPVSDLTALAMFHSNRGAEALARDELVVARDRLDAAVRLDPALASAWVNLGVVRRRLGDLDGARSAYLRGLDLEPAHPAARTNLRALVESAAGRDAASASLGRLLDADPLRDLERAGRLLDEGELAEARRWYDRALSLARGP